MRSNGASVNHRAMANSAMKSPCVNICVMDPATGWCEGCFRTLAEIGAWSTLSPGARNRVLQTLPGRRRAWSDLAPPCEAPAS